MTAPFIAERPPSAAEKEQSYKRALFYIVAIGTTATAGIYAAWYFDRKDPEPPHIAKQGKPPTPTDLTLRSRSGTANQSVTIQQPTNQEGTQTVYRCKNGEKTTYQDAPCKNGKAISYAIQQPDTNTLGTWQNPIGFKPSKDAYACEATSNGQHLIQWCQPSRQPTQTGNQITSIETNRKESDVAKPTLPKWPYWRYPGPYPTGNRPH